MSAGLKGYCYSHSSAVSPRCSVEHCSAQWRSTVAVSKITSSNYAVHAFLLCWPFLPHRPHMVLLTTHSHVVCSVCWAHTSKMCKNGWTDQDTIWRANFQNSQSMSRHIDKKHFWTEYVMEICSSCGRQTHVGPRNLVLVGDTDTPIRTCNFEEDVLAHCNV